MNPRDCPFCFADAKLVFHAGELVLGLWDAFPASPGHALIVPRRHVTSWFEATDEERAELAAATKDARRAIVERHHPAAFNVGINDGTAAGQTVPHLHVHVIPRYAGDVPDPRGGVRHVIPWAGRYAAMAEGEGKVEEERAAWISEVPLSAGTGATPSAAEAKSAEPSADTAEGATAFAEKILQLLDEGRFTATYKYAVLLALTDLCVEEDVRPGRSQALSTLRLAEKVVELYWPQTARYSGIDRREVVLAQNSSGQAEIVSAIGRFRERHAADPSEPLARARQRAPASFERLVRTIEWKLIEMPLPRLQLIGDTESRFLYDITWDRRVRRSDLERADFDHRIHLREGVADYLVRFSGLLRPLVQRAWAGMVASLNRDVTDESRLLEFLFGAPRISLDPVRQPLRELQNNRCFYCERAVSGPVEVDHFIPWARHPDNGIHNLVAVDQRCNGAKRDFLAAGTHVEHWASRLSGNASARAQLDDIASAAGWEQHPERTLNTARGIYARLPKDVRLWVASSRFATVAEERPKLVAALGLPGPSAAGAS
jgi:diadenosine tetraphosphate (Ap4A) HIT family hydrolase